MLSTSWLFFSFWRVLAMGNFKGDWFKLPREMIAQRHLALDPSVDVSDGKT